MNIYEQMISDGLVNPESDGSEIHVQNSVFYLPIGPGAVGAGAEGLEAAESALAEGVGAVARAGEEIPVTFIGQEAGPAMVVPRGASGPTPALNGSGVRYVGGTGGPGLDARVSGLRIMNPTGRYPGGYASYTNAAGQTVNPLTGQTIAPSNPWWHIILPW
jgi:hypothetical protein